MASPKTPYHITKDTEQVIVLALTTLPRFYQAVGYAVDPDRLPTRAAAALVWAVRRVARERQGEGCTDPSSAIQEIHAAIAGGIMESAVKNEAIDYLDSAMANNAMIDVEVLTQQTVAIAQYGAVQDVEDWITGKLGGVSPLNGSGIAEVADELAHRSQKAADIGRYSLPKVSWGTGDDNDFQRVLERSAYGGNLQPTGIPELDIALGGGIECKTFNLYIGGTGSGKTGYLTQQFVTAVLNGEPALYISFELEVEEIKSKIYRNIVDMDRAEMASNPSEGVRRFKMWRDAGMAEFCVVKMPPGSPIRRVLREIRNLQRDHNVVFKLVVLDYLDKMVGTSVAWEDVEKMADIFREQIAIENNGRVWSASQAVKGKSRKEEPLTPDDARGGAGKTHGADAILGGRRTKEDLQSDTIRFDIVKRRIGPGEGREVGPLLRDVERGRIVMLDRKNPWDVETESVGLVPHEESSAPHDVLVTAGAVEDDFPLEGKDEAEGT